MTRSYRAARRLAEREGVPFDYEWFEEEREFDEDGNVVSVVEVVRSEHFVCKGRANTLLLSELSYNAELDTADPAAMRLIREFFSQAFGDEAEYRRFFDLHGKHGDDDLLMDIMSGLVEDFQVGRMERPSLSPVGESSIGPVSKVVSFSKRSVELVEELPEEPGSASGS